MPTNQNKMKWISNLLLLLAALIWGSGFVAQRIGAGTLETFSFVCIRSFIAAAFLLPVALIAQRFTPPQERERMHHPKKLWLAGLICGVCMFLAAVLQQAGVKHTTAGKAGFLTALYIVIVPILQLFMKKRMGLWKWFSVLLALIGTYLLCVTEGFSVGRGDVLLLGCAFMYAVHLIVVDRAVAVIDAIWLSCLQFLFCGLFALLPMFLFETPTVAAIAATWAPLLYLGILSSGVAFTLQLIAQKHLEPSVASLICCSEAVFAVLAGWILLHESFSVQEGIGCALVFIGIVTAQLRFGKKELPSLPEQPTAGE